MSMGTNSTLPFADTIYCDIRKIIETAFDGCTQKDMDRLCLMGYYVNNDMFLTTKETIGCAFRFNVGSKRLPDGKYKLNVCCEFYKDEHDGEDEIETLYEVAFFDDLKTKKKCFNDLHSALAYCDEYEAEGINIDDYITDIE